MNKKAQECLEKFNKSLDAFEKITRQLAQSDSKLTKEETKEFTDVFIIVFDSAKELMLHLPQEQAIQIKNTLFSSMAILGVNPKEIIEDPNGDVYLNTEAQYVIEMAKTQLETHLETILDNYIEGKLDKKTMETNMKNTKKALNQVEGF